MTTSSNWVHDKNPQPSLNDKIMDLLKIKSKLVLVQVHELERIKLSTHKDRYVEYINLLYKHYIIDGLSKTYLC